MSDLLTAASQTLGIPEALVKRSAEARAKANGISVDQVLQAWSGGGAVGMAAPVQEEAALPAEHAVAAPEPSPATTEEAPIGVEAVEAPAAIAVAEAAPVPPAAAVEVEPVESAPLARRVRVAGRIGGLAGVVVALLVVVGSAAWTLPRASILGAEGNYRPAFEAIGGWLIAGNALIGAVVGVAVAALTRWGTGWMGPGMRLVSSQRATGAVGAIAGFVGGALVGAVIAGSGRPSELTEGVLVVPVLGSAVWLVVGWVAIGWAIGAATQALGVPEGIPPDESEETEAVRRRLVAAFGIPAAAVVGILFLVLPLAFVFIRYPEWAPFLGIFVAGSILGFAGLAASRPNLRIGLGDFLMAAVGIGVVVLIILAVLNAQGAGGAESGETSAGQTSVLSI